MTTMRDDILRQAIVLSPEDRAWLADALEISLLPAEFVSSEIPDVWKEEIDRRMRACERGEVQFVDMETVFKDLHESLAQVRSRHQTKS